MTELQNLINTKDYFCKNDGITYAGKHLIIDMWGAKHLDDVKFIEHTLINTIKECQATLLNILLHRFLPSGGVSGVAVLAESHISIHTWPEKDYVALDVFMCGKAKPETAIAILQKAFEAKYITVNSQLRGVLGASVSRL